MTKKTKFPGENTMIPEESSINSPEDSSIKTHSKSFQNSISHHNTEAVQPKLRKKGISCDFQTKNSQGSNSRTKMKMGSMESSLATANSETLTRRVLSS